MAIAKLEQNICEKNIEIAKLREQIASKGDGDGANRDQWHIEKKQLVNTNNLLQTELDNFNKQLKEKDQEIGNLIAKRDKLKENVITLESKLDVNKIKYELTFPLHFLHIKKNLSPIPTD